MVRRRTSRLDTKCWTVAVLLLATACNGASGRDGQGLAGTLSADGSSTVFPITQAVAEAFSERAPEVKVSVGTSGTGGGFEKFCNAETDISDASRPMEEEEQQTCKRKGVEFLELTVATDGLSIVVNPDNHWAGCLTVGELKEVWRPKSRIENWSQVRQGFPSRPLKLYGAGTDSGTFDYFTEVIVGEGGASRSDYVASEDDNVLVQGIAGDENALGYFGYGYYLQNKRKVKPVAVDSGSGCVAPSAEAIQSGRYEPLSRPLFIYVGKKAAGRDEVKAFVDFYLAKAPDFVEDVGYLALRNEDAQKELLEWKAFIGDQRGP